MDTTVTASELYAANMVLLGITLVVTAWSGSWTRWLERPEIRGERSLFAKVLHHYIPRNLALMALVGSAALNIAGAVVIIGDAVGIETTDPDKRITLGAWLAFYAVVMFAFAFFIMLLLSGFGLLNYLETRLPIRKSRRS